MHGICILADDTEQEGAVEKLDGCSIIQREFWQSGEMSKQEYH